MTSTLWTYTDSVDEEGATLTVETEGPSHEQPGKMARQENVIEVKSNDSKVFTSSVLRADGTWTTMVSVDNRGKK